jgi:hypothetical protein
LREPYFPKFRKYILTRSREEFSPHRRGGIIVILLLLLIPPSKAKVKTETNWILLPGVRPAFSPSRLRVVLPPFF